MVNKAKRLNVSQIEDYVTKDCLLTEGAVNMMVDVAQIVCAARDIKPGISIEDLNRIVDGIECSFRSMGKDVVLIISLEEAIEIFKAAIK